MNKLRRLLPLLLFLLPSVAYNTATLDGIRSPLRRRSVAASYPSLPHVLTVRAHKMTALLSRPQSRTAPSFVCRTPRRAGSNSSSTPAPGSYASALASSLRPAKCQTGGRRATTTSPTRPSLSTQRPRARRRTSPGGKGIDVLMAGCEDTSYYQARNSYKSACYMLSSLTTAPRVTKRAEW